MHKKILLFFIPLFLLASCSAPITFPNISEEINKYGIDVGQEDSAIIAQIKEHLEQSYKDNGYYKLVFIGIPKQNYSQSTSVSGMVLNEASKISAQNVIVDISDVDFQNEAIPASMFTGNPDNKITVLNFIFPQNKIKTIRTFAFHGLHNNLKEVTIPDSVITIGDRSFQLNYVLEKLTLGNNVQTIEEDAFLYSTALTELTIPASVKTIKDHAFGSSPKLSKVIYLGTSPNDINFGKDIFTSTKLTTLIVPNAENINYSAWDINPKQANSIDDNIKDVFSIAAKQLLGVKRELMLYLGSQVVNGVNHAFICRSTVVYPSALPYYEIIICNVSADNEISIVKLDKIIESSQSEVGGIVCTSSDEAKINISNSKEAKDLIKIFQNAVKDIKDIKYTQELYVASQVVKGVNYSFVAKALSNDGSSSVKLLTINNFMESSEVIEVEDIL